MRTKGGGLTAAGAVLLLFTGVGAATAAQAQSASAKPNILVVWGDDVGQSNISTYTRGLVGYKTPNIDRIASEGMRFTDSYGQQSRTAGRAAFTTGQNPYRTGLTKVGMPGADILQAEDATIAELLKPLGYATPRDIQARGGYIVAANRRGMPLA